MCLEFGRGALRHRPDHLVVFVLQRGDGEEAGGAALGHEQPRSSQPADVGPAKVGDQPFRPDGPGELLQGATFGREGRGIERRDGGQQSIVIRLGQAAGLANEPAELPDRSLLGERPGPFADQRNDGRDRLLTAPDHQADNRGANLVVGVEQRPADQLEPRGWSHGGQGPSGHEAEPRIGIRQKKVGDGADRVGSDAASEDPLQRVPALLGRWTGQAAPPANAVACPRAGRSSCGLRRRVLRPKRGQVDPRLTLGRLSLCLGPEGNLHGCEDGFRPHVVVPPGVAGRRFCHHSAFARAVVRAQGCT